MGKKINIRKLSFSYKRKSLQLDHINLSIKSGEVIVLTGPSGSGKSSLTRVINGLIPYFFNGELVGEVTIGEQNFDQMKSWERGQLVGNVFQDPRSQFFSNEVAGEIAFGCENYGYSHEEIRDRVHRAADSLKISNILERSLHELSYGMRQKVAIASAKALEPEIYVMDEPSANLDMESTYCFSEVIEELKRRGKTIIIAEHRLYYLEEIADRFICIENGAIKHEFSQEQMKELKDRDILQMGLRHSNLRRFTFHTLKSHKNAEVALEVKALSKAYDKLQVIREMNFSCNRGEVIALIGPNGTGKSTLGKVFAGLVKEDQGSISIFGKECKAKKRLGQVWYIPQDLDSQLFGEDLVDELITGRKNAEEQKEKAVRILKELELHDYAKQHPATLSGGQKQRLALGVALMYEAPIIILDEPTSGLDGANMRNVSRVIRALAGKGHTIIVITHDAECALSCCERAIRIEKGIITDDFQITDSEYFLARIGYP